MTSANQARIGSASAPVSAMIHELLLRFAGQIDDDILDDARSLLAAVEADRALVLVCAALSAAGVPVDNDRLRMLHELTDAVGLSPVILSEIQTNRGSAHGQLTAPQHRFTSGIESGRDPGEGVIEVLAHVLPALSGVHAAFCVWRTTSIDGVAGATPRRILLLETRKPEIAATLAHRVGTALRQHGIAASVEVVHDDRPLPDYHDRALTAARRLDLPEQIREDEPEEPAVERAEHNHAADAEDVPNPVTTFTSRRHHRARQASEPPRFEAAEAPAPQAPNLPTQQQDTAPPANSGTEEPANVWAWQRPTDIEAPAQAAGNGAPAELENPAVQQQNPGQWDGAHEPTDVLRIVQNGREDT